MRQSDAVRKLSSDQRILIQETAVSDFYYCSLWKVDCPLADFCNTISPKACAAANSRKLCGAFNPHIDFAAQRPKVDWFCKQRLSSTLQSPALRLRIAIGGNHDDWNIRPQCFGLGQEFKTAHPRNVDVAQDQNERSVACVGDALKCHWGGLGKLHGKPGSTEITPEVLAKQHLDIGLIVNHENKQAHARPFDFDAGSRVLQYSTSRTETVCCASQP